MSESVFLPIINIGPTDVIYEKISYDKTKEAHKSAELFGSDGSEITTKKNDITNGTEFFVVRGNKNQAGKYVKDNFDYDKFFIKNNTYGGRKRKQSKYSSKKRSVKSRRHSRKSRYSRRR